MAQIIMIASGKGGTGKSTVASFLALELALKGFKIFLTELDLGLRSIDSISGVSDMAVYDIGDVLLGNCDYDKALIVSHHTNNLHIMPAPSKQDGIDYSKLKSFVDVIYNRYDYIILDVPAGIGDAFKQTLYCADTAIIVATPDVVSVRDARIVSDEIYAKSINNIKLVINKYDKNTFKYSGFVDADQIIDESCAQLLGVIPYSREIQLASMQGKLIDKKCICSKIFSDMADRLRGKHYQINIK